MDLITELEELIALKKRLDRLEKTISLMQGQLEEKMKRIASESGEDTLKKAQRCLKRQEQDLSRKREKLKVLTQEWEEKWGKSVSQTI